uniref:Ferredoxin n=1 Tax=Zea mays TaxID=4577 RepID=B6TW78_MAIZE|nr:ferredoxin [Zea mays]
MMSRSCCLAVSVLLAVAATASGAIAPALLHEGRLEDIDACSAECEVHIAQEWLDKLPPPSYEERYVLTRASRNRELNKHARLGCQVVLAPELQGMVVAIPEPKPWDIP